MSWTKTAMESPCDLPDPGWTNAEAPEAACDVASQTAYGFDDDTLVDTGTRSSSAGWTVTDMDSVCD